MVNEKTPHTEVAGLSSQHNFRAALQSPQDGYIYRSPCERGLLLYDRR